MMSCGLEAYIPTDHTSLLAIWAEAELKVISGGD
jgi:hypothetical protein